ncbi:response regulator transcription factor [Fonticella tunisiensis]|uniref:Stage 0 sporulation protein A homolog n=1 Tax=Fonticella tunisiensis TaxID=1096341 RepID=A0A4R7KL54_9CLOT|nr:response regulator transcription factor [Fonticella tunisiensis]TDT57291.1 DNA-binding response OmpR family regulator [Fonticella tunisiensis]
MADRKSILVIDDEIKIVEFVKSYLEREGYEVYTAFSGREAMEAFKKNSPSLVILDLMLPDISGEEVCKRLRRRSRIPIIMLTAKVQEENILEGFALGADDYVTKPFSPRQLVARVKALLRRTEEVIPLSDTMSFNDGDLVIDSVKHEVKKGNNIVNLTPTEYKLLLTMIKYPHKAFTRDELICLVLGDEYDGYDRVIDTHIKNLRQKIEDNTKEPKYIITIHGVGYRFGGE